MTTSFSKNRPLKILILKFEISRNIEFKITEIVSIPKRSIGHTAYFYFPKQFNFPLADDRYIGAFLNQYYIPYENETIKNITKRPLIAQWKWWNM